MSGGGSVRRDDNSARPQGFATVQCKLIFVKRFGMGIQADAIRWQMRSDLCRNGAHAARGNGGVAFRKHFEHEFKLRLEDFNSLSNRIPAKNGRKKR